MAELWAVEGDQNSGFLHPVPPTDTAEGSGTVFCYGAPVHRNGDLRKCGATTVVTGQSTVKVG